MRDYLASEVRNIVLLFRQDRQGGKPAGGTLH